MKKFLPVFILFGIVFTASLAIQVGATTISAATKTKSKNEEIELNFTKIKTTTIDGKNVEASKLTAPVVLVNFWASWCIPCMEEMPSLVNLKKKFKDNELIVLSMNTDENEQLKNINKTMKKFNIGNEFMVVADQNTKIADTFKLSAIPVTMIFNRGKLVEFDNGPVDFNSVELSEKIKKWIKN